MLGERKYPPEGAWGLIQHANNNPADEFRAYATEQFKRCKALMQSEGFAAHVEAVRAAQ